MSTEFTKVGPNDLMYREIDTARGISVVIIDKENGETVVLRPEDVVPVYQRLLATVVNHNLR